MNKKKMKKYFMQGTAEELKFGDMIVLDLSKDLKNGNVKYHHLECRFIPQIVPLLLSQGIIEEKDVEENKKAHKPQQKKTLESTDANLSMLEELVKANQNLEHRVYDLEKVVAKLGSLVMTLGKAVAYRGNTQKNAKKQNRK